MATVRFVHDGPRFFDVDRHTRHTVNWVDLQDVASEATERVESSIVEVAIAMTNTEPDVPAIALFFEAAAEAELPKAYDPLILKTTTPAGMARISASRSRWTLSVAPGQIRDRTGTASEVAYHGLAWDVDTPEGMALQSPDGLEAALGDWLNRNFHRASVIARLIATSEELVSHLRAALDERDELRRRLVAALGSEQHAADRIRVLEVQVAALEVQLLEAAAAVAAGKQELIDQSKGAMLAMASIVISLLGLVSSLASPFVSDWLANEDTQALVAAQRETTAAIEAMNDPGHVELTIETALRCVLEGDDAQ